MLNIALLLGASLVILGVARYNKSNKLFWQLLMATLLGFASGHLGATYGAYKAPDKKSTKEVISAPITSSISAIDDNMAIFERIQPEVLPKHTKQNLFRRDIVLLLVTDILAFNPDSDIGVTTELFDTS